MYQRDACTCVYIVIDPNLLICGRMQGDCTFDTASFVMKRIAVGYLTHAGTNCIHQHTRAGTKSLLLSPTKDWLPGIFTHLPSREPGKYIKNKIIRFSVINIHWVFVEIIPYWLNIYILNITAHSFIRSTVHNYARLIRVKFRRIVPTLHKLSRFFWRMRVIKRGGK